VVSGDADVCDSCEGFEVIRMAAYGTQFGRKKKKGGKKSWTLREKAR